MTRQYFKFPFAELGDTEVIPQTVQSDGSISWQEGYGPNYALDPLLDPDALDVPRLGENELFNVVTEALQQLQQDGTPDFITNSDNLGTNFPYTFNQRALYEGQAYRSLINANTNLPNAGNGSWQVDNLLIQGTAGGTANALTLWPSQTYQAFQFGDTVQFIASVTNTDVTTIKVGTASAIALMKATALGVVDLDANDISIGLNTAVFDGTEWILLNPSNLGQIIQYAQVAFQAATNQSIPATTDTLIAYDNVLYDPNSWWDPINFQFLPTIPGVYRINHIVHFTNDLYVMVFKNGDLSRRVGEVAVGTAVKNTAGGSYIVQMNGTTDFLSPYCNSLTTSVIGNDGGSGAGDTTCLFEIEYLGSSPDMLMKKIKAAEKKRVPYSATPSGVLIPALEERRIIAMSDREEMLKQYGIELEARREKLKKIQTKRGK